MNRSQRYGAAMTQAIKPAGLPIIESCEGCGACCNGQEALPIGFYSGILDPEARTHLPPWLLDEIDAMSDKFDADNSWPRNGEPCVWFDAETKKCKHYDYRPSICVEFERGGEDCRYVRTRAGIDAAQRSATMPV